MKAEISDLIQIVFIPVILFFICRYGKSSIEYVKLSVNEPQRRIHRQKNLYAAKGERRRDSKAIGPELVLLSIAIFVALVFFAEKHGVNTVTIPLFHLALPFSLTMVTATSGMLFFAFLVSLILSMRLHAAMEHRLFISPPPKPYENRKPLDKPLNPSKSILIFINSIGLFSLMINSCLIVGLL